MKYQKFSKAIRTSKKRKLIKFTPGQIEALKTTSNITLAVIAAAGAITIAAVAPNLFVAIDKLFIKKYPNRRLSRREKEEKVIRTFYYLKKSGLIQIKPEGSGFKVSITKLGREKIPKLDFESLAVPRTQDWDGKWWQVAADIPTKEHRQGADMFRKKLKQMAFYPLQRSLWFYPYNPSSEIQHICEYYGIAQFITVMEISRMDKEDESRMKEFFISSNLI